MKRLPMRKIREALRLRADGFSGRQVAQSLSLGRATISEYFRRADVEGLSWPLPADLSDAELERRLFAYSCGEARRVVPLPDWTYVHAELRRKGVTLSLLWEEYRGVHPDGYGYSRYCELYTRWEGKLSPVMRQRHPAGERLVVDYAGHPVDVVCPKTGELRTTQIFVATLGASNYTYVEATWTQSLPDWISSHVRAFEFFSGVPAQLVLDNLKAGVTKACFYDPAINRTYSDMAAHYDTAIVPACPYKPKDKAKVEGAALKPLPVTPYVYAEWKQCRAGLDYHVDIGRHYYSVPHQLLRQKLWARITVRTVEVYFKGQRVASHARTSGNRQHSTHRDHMPAHHRFREDWTPERIRQQALRIGPNVEAFVEVVMRQRKHPEQGYRTCLGVLRLAKVFGKARIDAGCERALTINTHSYTSLHSILKNGLDRNPRTRATDEPAITHPNIRGADYFH